MNKEDVVLEIGPGKGALTSKLLEKAGLVIAIEKDRDLIEILEEKFKEEIEEGRFILINKDILELNLSEMSQNLLLKSLGNRVDDGQRKFEASNFCAFQKQILAKENSINYKIIANIPYNITGAILKKFLTENMQPSLMVLMVQNEVAKRIVANNEGESILSISVKVYGQPKTIMKVQKKYFSPAPKVDSAIILINNINKDLFTKENINEEKFWSLVHAGFAHKRKVLISNLKNLDKNKDWKGIFSELNLNEKIRAEELKVDHWVKLTQSIS